MKRARGQAVASCIVVYSVNVQPLHIAISEPPTQSEVRAILDRLNELITGVYRAP